MTTLKQSLLGGALVIVMLATHIMLPVETQPQPVQATQADKPFDHSQCQYPTRTTNPVDGCDNSDPCDPQSAAKGGSGECAPTEPTPTPVTPFVPPVKANSCEGK